MKSAIVWTLSQNGPCELCDTLIQFSDVVTMGRGCGMLSLRYCFPQFPHSIQLYHSYVVNPFVMNPFVVNPFVMNPFVMNPFIMNPFVMNPFVMNPFVMNPFVLNLFV